MPDNSRFATTLARFLLVTGVAFAAFGCSSSGDSQPDTVEPTLEAALPDNDAIMTKVYAASVSTPPGFYVDPRSDPAMSYTIHHIKNTLIAAGAAADFELCSDDMAVAMDWSEMDNEQRAVGGALVTTQENDLYFEFVRPLTDVPDWINYGRVLKCSFVDRSGADSGSLLGPAGRLTKTAFTPDDVRQVGEYLWSFSRFHNSGNAVLQSDGFTTSGVIGHTLTLASLRRGAGAVVGCDAIDVSDWDLQASVSDGELTWTSRSLFSFDARLINGIPEACGPQ